MYVSFIGECYKNQNNFNFDLNLKEKMKRKAEQKAPDVTFKDIRYEMQLGKGKWTTRQL